MLTVRGSFPPLIASTSSLRSRLTISSTNAFRRTGLEVTLHLPLPKLSCAQVYPSPFCKRLKKFVVPLILFSYFFLQPITSFLVITSLPHIRNCSDFHFHLQVLDYIFHHILPSSYFLRCPLIIVYFV